MKKSKQFFLRLPNLETFGATLQTHALPEEIQSHLKALRVKTGEAIKFSNGQGHWKIYSSQDKSVFTLLSEGAQDKPSPHITLHLSPPRGDALTESISNATQLGVSEIRFFCSEFCQYTGEQLSNSTFVERAKRIAEAACLSSERNWDVTISSGQNSTLQMLESIHNSGPEESSLVLFADETLAETGQWGTEAPEAFRNIKQIHILIGPEGGFSEKERALMARTQNILQIGLGPNVLRVPAAIGAAITLAQFYISRFR
jgi:16S rRNA (uracil1498-N3)-methyltransferase